MEKPRSLSQQAIGRKMLFVVFLLFPTDILAEVATEEAIHVDATANPNVTTSPFPASSKMNAEISMTSLPDATTPEALNVSLSISGQPSLSFKEEHPVSKQELQSVAAAKLPVPEDPSSPMPSKDTVSTEEKQPPTEATKVQGSKPLPIQKEVPSDMTVTSRLASETVSSPTKDLGTRSQGRFSEQSSSAIAYLETTKSTKEDKSGPKLPDQVVPGLTQTPETGSHYMSGPLTTLGTLANDATKSEISDEGSSGKKLALIILAVAFAILLLVGLLAFLYFRRRRHSGSTSFNSPEWAGQATLPDDTGLDKDVEQQAGSVGEGETRRGTLVTFFGKRQSRVPSIAMEDVNGKGGKGETEQLLGGEAEIGSPSKAAGDANGKVPEPLKGSSQKSPAPNK